MRSSGKPKDDTVVSVVTPAYNEYALLKKMLNCMLEQDYSRPYEIVLVDDASPENIQKKVAKDFKDQLDNKKIVLYRNPINIGASATRNKGAQLASGKYLLFADADELFMSNHIAEMVQPVVDGVADIVAQHTKTFIDHTDTHIHTRSFGYRGSTEFKLFLLGLTGSDILLAKKDFENLGGFNANMKYAEDWEFVVRAYQSGMRLHFDDSGTKHHREHDQSITDSFDWTQHRLSTMIPAIMSDDSYSARQRAQFIYGTLISSRVSLIPSLLRSIITIQPLFFIQHPEWVFYAGLSISNRINRRLSRRTSAV